MQKNALLAALVPRRQELAPAQVSVERQQQLAELLVARRHLTIPEIERALGSSRSTIRRDLLELERRGVAHRVFGGVVASPPDP